MALRQHRLRSYRAHFPDPRARGRVAWGKKVMVLYLCGPLPDELVIVNINSLWAFAPNGVQTHIECPGSRDPTLPCHDAAEATLATD